MLGPKLRRTLFVSLFGLAFCACLAPVRLNAQVLYGSVVGNVTDQTGAVVPGAHITITNPLTGLKREADSDSGGSFLIPNLPDGTYELEASSRGFKPFKQTGVILKVGTVVRNDVRLEVGAVTQEVTVQASAAVLQTEKSDVSNKISAVAVENLPTGFYRNFQMLMVLSPGAGIPCEGCTGSIVDTPERAVEIGVNGLRSGDNMTRIDGAESPFLWKPEGGTLYVPPIESIQEVNVTTSNYDPEKGMAGAAAVDVITKSGTNSIHGVAFWYHFDQHLLSCEPFDYSCKKIAGYPPENKPKQLLNDMGGNLGGPIKKNKLFWFANWDGVFQRTNFSRFMTVPDALQKAGNFSKVLGTTQIVDANGTPVTVPMTDGHGNITGTTGLVQGMIFDPTTGDINGNGRAVFAAGGAVNTIPSDRFWPGVGTFLQNSPDPNAPPLIDSFFGPYNNYFESENQKFDRNNIDFKIDWIRNEKHQIWWKYSTMNALTSAPCGLNAQVGGACAESWGDSGRHHDLVQVVTIAHTWSVSPTFVIDGNIGYSRMGINGHPADFGKNVGTEVLKIPNTNASDPRTGGIPGITIGGYGDPLWTGNNLLYGSPTTWNPYYRNDWSLTNSHNATLIHGKHTFRFGTDIVHHHMNHWQPENGFGPRGGFSWYYSDTTFLNTGNMNLGSNAPFEIRENGFAAFLLGMYDGGGKAIQFVKMNGKEWEYGFHFLDRWQIRPKLTANLGFRYEYYPLMSRDSLGKGIEQYDPNTNNVLLGGLGGNPKNLGITTSTRYFAPRVGLAYQLNSKSVVRAGYGITFDPYPILRELRGTYPSVISNSAWSNTSFQPAGTFAQGIPVEPLPDVSRGSIPLPLDVDVRFVGPGELKRGIIQTWNLTYERRLPQDFLLDVAYVGNHMYDGWSQYALNSTRNCELPPPTSLPADTTVPAGTTLVATCHLPPLLVKWGRTPSATTNQLQGFVYSHYNSLQVMVERHFEKGLYMHLAYTYSKAIDLQNQGSGWDSPSYSGPGYLQRNRGMEDDDHRHILRLAYVWQLPLGAGQRWSNRNRVGRVVLGGWQVNGIYSLWTGQPLTLTARNRLHSVGNMQTVDQVGAIKKIGHIGSGTYYYDPASFSGVPDAGNLYTPESAFSSDAWGPGQTRFGSTGRNIAVYGPGHGNLDAGLFRHFKLRENLDMQFRAESQNLSNTPTWDNPDTSCRASGASSCVINSDDPTKKTPFLQIVHASGHRNFRLGLRFQF